MTQLRVGDRITLVADYLGCGDPELPAVVVDPRVVVEEQPLLLVSVQSCFSAGPTLVSREQIKELR